MLFLPCGQLKLKRLAALSKSYLSEYIKLNSQRINKYAKWWQTASVIFFG
jgi:hypothetical protein